MRVAIYARFSSENQRDASIDDQIRVCRARAEREQWQVVEIFTDYAISGSTTLRPGFQGLLAAARAGAFNVALAESLDRLSRDQEHVAGLFKQLGFNGIKLVTLAEGEINELHVGLKGTMNALFLKDLAAKTHRGLEGRIQEGRSAGGRCYGYDVVKELDPRGEPIRGGRAINSAEAEVVQRIFRAFAAGHSPRAIAKTLNAGQIPGPNGGAWRDTTIRGHAERGTGILRNRLYIGEMIWNRLSFIKDPSTGKRISRPNDKSELRTADVPELRIVSQDLWDQVKDRLDGIRASERCTKVRASQFWKHRRARHLLTGKLSCGCCGGPIVQNGKDYLVCSASRNQGTCDNRRSIRRPVLDNLILDALRHQLMQPDVVKEFIAAYVAEFNSLQQTLQQERQRRERDQAQITRKLDQLIDAVSEGFRSADLQQRLDDLSSRKDELKRQLDKPLQSPPRLHPNLADHYRAKVDQLHLALANESIRPEALEEIRSLIERVVLSPSAEDPEGVEIELVGDIANMVHVACERKKAAPDGAAVLDAYRRSIKVVAGARFELTAFRL
ncbi:recombinase family protein [Zavarzinia compransoris]|uniref:Serine recombinase n=1 Tax=Zavarzinia compransoris TaxID=1264899 RepID=A0A317DZ94_9PROT|nr:recombinase family protein [Zavarzinia compransoris]PWR18373.1 serine recombinase [Zavarzinia compransoris]